MSFAPGHKELTDEYKEKFASPYIAAERGALFRY